MRIDRPPPGEELNEGETTEPRLAATAILLRDGEASPEVLLVRRNPEQRFMGGAWVFPGGAVDDGDGDPADAARRELAEEATVALDGGAELVPFSRWVTPSMVKVRFDTWFFVARAPEGVEAVPDGDECVDACWLTAQAALDAGEREELTLHFPTIKHLEDLARFESVAATLDDARARTVEPIQPRVLVGDGDAQVLLPGEPGYEDGV